MLSVSGNSNHLGCFLADFEAAIKNNNEEGKSFTMAPNYYAWICAASEHVFYSIREIMYLNTEDDQVFDFAYTKLLNYIIENNSCNKEELESILLFAKMRHLIVHKGFPNPHVVPSENEREIAKGHTFRKSEIEEMAVMLRNTNSFTSLYESHRCAIKAISSLQKKTNYDFGIMQITNKC